MKNCLLCGTLNNDDSKRCSLCKTEPGLALRVVTESRRWVTATLIVTVFLSLVGAVALDLYLANRAFFGDREEASTAMGNSSIPSDKNSTAVERTSTVANLAQGREMARLTKDIFLIIVWMFVSIGFVGGVMYGTSKGIFILCTAIMRRVLDKEVAHKEYVYPGIRIAYAARASAIKTHSRGTL